MKNVSIIKVIGSGSSGNCIAIYDSRGKYILLDVGMKYTDILDYLSYDLKECSGIFVSHRHKDHTLSLDKFKDSNIPCYANSDVKSVHDWITELPSILKYDGWKIQTFELKHNVPNNAFIIDTYDGIRILYCTDTKTISKLVKNVNYAIIECNYSSENILNDICDGIETRSQYDNHLEVKETCRYLNAIFHCGLQGVILHHLSSTNGNEKEFKTLVESELGFSNVYIAKRGLEVKLEKSEF